MSALREMSDEEMIELYEECKKYTFARVSKFYDEIYYKDFNRYARSLNEKYGYKYSINFKDGDDTSSVEKITVLGHGDTYVFDVKKEFKLEQRKNKIKSLL